MNGGDLNGGDDSPSTCISNQPPSAETGFKSEGDYERKESYNVGRHRRSCDLGPVAQWLRRRAYVNIPMGVFMSVPRRFVVQSRAGPLFLIHK